MVSPYLLALFFLVPSTTSRVLYVSSLSPCSALQPLQFGQFQLNYDASSHVLDFDIYVGSTASFTNSSVALLVEAYGLRLLDKTFNLCTDLGGILCTIPQTELIGLADSVKFPSSIYDQLKLPSVAYSMPDLEVSAYARLLSPSGEEQGCLRIDPANSKTMQLPGVSWAIGGIVIAVFLTDLIKELLRFRTPGRLQQGQGPERFVTTFLFFQWVASIGLLAIDYPRVLVAFTSNFAWTLGLIPIQRFQRSFTSTISATGGSTETVGMPVWGGTQSLATLQLPSNYTTFPGSALSFFAKAIEPFASASASMSLPLSKRSVSTSPTTDISRISLDSLSYGIPRYLATLEIPVSNAFLTVLITFLLLICFFIAFTALVLLCGRISSVTNKTGRDIYARLLDDVRWNLVRAAALRFLLITWFPILAFSFFQWTLESGWFSVNCTTSRLELFQVPCSTVYVPQSRVPLAFSILIVLSVCGALFALAFQTFMYLRRHQGETLDPLPMEQEATRPFWNSYNPNRRWFFLVVLLYTFVRACFIGGGANDGLAQVIGLLIVEVALGVALFSLSPFTSRAWSRINKAIQVLKIVISALLVPLSPTVSISGIAATVLGFIIIVIECLITLGLVIIIMIDFVSILRTKKQPAPMGIRTPANLTLRTPPENPPPPEDPRGAPPPFESLPPMLPPVVERLTEAEDFGISIAPSLQAVTENQNEEKSKEVDVERQHTIGNNSTRVGV